MKYYEIEFNISPATQDACDLVAAYAGEVGFETFDEISSGLLGYIQQSLFDIDSLDAVLVDFPIAGVSITYEVREAEDKDWNEAWENEGFEPIVIDGRLVIHDGRHLFEFVDGYEMVEIDAKMAFGTGNHETTRMIVSTLLNMELTEKTILDCGCGTGILSISALKYGASRAVGYDIDEWSVYNARHNAAINRVDDRFLSVQGDASVIQSIDGAPFDIVVANINRNILLADMPAFVSAMKAGSTLILSGFYTDDVEILKGQAHALNLLFVSERDDNGWSSLVFRLA